VRLSVIVCVVVLAAAPVAPSHGAASGGSAEGEGVPESRLSRALGAASRLTIEPPAINAAGFILSSGAMTLRFESGLLARVRDERGVVGVTLSGRGTAVYDEKDPDGRRVFAWNLSRATGLSLKEDRMTSRVKKAVFLWPDGIPESIQARFAAGGAAAAPVAESVVPPAAAAARVAGGASDARAEERLPREEGELAGVLSDLLDGWQKSKEWVFPVRRALALEGGGLHDELLADFDGRENLLWRRGASGDFHLSVLRPGDAGPVSMPLRSGEGDSLAAGWTLTREHLDLQVGAPPALAIKARLHLEPGSGGNRPAAEGALAESAPNPDIVSFALIEAREIRIAEFVDPSLGFAAKVVSRTVPPGVRVRAVRDAAGRPLEFVHAQGTLLVRLPETVPANTEQPEPAPPSIQRAPESVPPSIQRTSESAPPSIQRAPESVPPSIQRAPEPTPSSSRRKPESSIDIEVELNTDLARRPAGHEYFTLRSPGWFPVPNGQDARFAFSWTIRSPEPFRPVTGSAEEPRAERRSDHSPAVGAGEARPAAGGDTPPPEVPEFVVDQSISLPVRHPILACGKYVERTAIAGRTPVRVWSYARANPQGESIARFSAAAVSFYEGLYGRYPFPALDIVEAAPGTGGQSGPGILLVEGMDSAELARRRRSTGALEFNMTFAHEIAHQWWGQSVSWKSARDEWLFEALAEYSGWLYLRTLKGNLGELAGRQWLARAKASAATASIAEADELTDDAVSRRHRANLIYAKGALALRRLARETGEKAFLAALAAFARGNAGREVDAAGLLDALNRATGRDLRPLWNEWVQGVGLPQAAGED